MALEIERRFLVRLDGPWRHHVLWSQSLRQGYLTAGAEGFTVRVRSSRGADANQGPADDQAWLTLKAPAGGLARHEFEYPIPPTDADALLALAPVQLVKRRYGLDLPGGDWVLDVFGAANAPLAIAEVELERADQPVPIPPWCSLEISGRGELSNAALARQPFGDWPPQAQEPILRHLALEGDRQRG
jgi:CYTH domain-containing protein